MRRTTEENDGIRPGILAIIVAVLVVSVACILVYSHRAKKQFGAPAVVQTTSAVPSSAVPSATSAVAVGVYTDSAGGLVVRGRGADFRFVQTGTNRPLRVVPEERVRNEQSNRRGQ